MDLLFEYSFTAQSSFTVTHGLGLEFVDVSIVVDANRRMDLITSVEPNTAAPTNAIDVVLNGTYTGLVQIFSRKTLAGGEVSNTKQSNINSITVSQSLAQITGADASTSEPMLTFIDTTRLNKQLSVETTAYAYGRNTVNKNALLRPAQGNSNFSGYIMPYNGTVIRASLVTVNNAGQSRSFSIYVNLVENTGVLSTIGLGEQTATNSAVNIDFLAGDKLIMRGRGPGGTIQATTALLWVKWRV